jgi:cation transporter-like permease
MQTSSKTTAINDPIAAFMAAKAEIDVQLARLIATSEDHFGMAPDDVQWGHVTTLQDTLAALRALHA